MQWHSFFCIKWRKIVENATTTTTAPTTSAYLWNAWESQYLYASYNFLQFFFYIKLLYFIWLNAQWHRNIMIFCVSTIIMVEKKEKKTEKKTNKIWRKITLQTSFATTINMCKMHATYLQKLNMKTTTTPNRCIN